MLESNRVLLFAAMVVFLLPLAAAGQYKFEGAIRNTEDYTSFPTTYANATVTVFIPNGLAAGTAPAGSLTNCAGTPIVGNSFPASYSFCFKGPLTSYDVQVTYTNYTKTQRFISEDNIKTPGIYRVTDFGAMSSPSADNTYVIKSAMAYIGMRAGPGLEPGGRLIVPNGLFKVLDSGTALPIVLPPGLTLEGTNGRGDFGSSRIQLEGANKTLFRIGNNTSSVTIRDLALIMPLDCPGAPNPCTVYAGTKAIYAAGNGLSSQHFSAVNLTIGQFEEGISVEGLDANQDWQFGSAKIDNSTIAGCLYPIRLKAQNAELFVSNSVLLTIKHSGGEEAGLRIDRAGGVTLLNTWGGIAYRDVNNKPLAFILIKGRMAGLRLINVTSENTLHSFLYDYAPPDNDLKPTFNFDGVSFGDLVIFKGNAVLHSVGSNYGSNSVQFWGSQKNGSSTSSQIYSYGDQFAPLTNKLHVCPAQAGVTVNYYPPPAQNGDWTRLTDSDIEPNSADLDRNVCRRDFYLYNSPSEKNTVVARTAQRKYSTGDSASLESTQVQGPLEIVQQPVYDGTLSRAPVMERFKTWGYKIQRNNNSGDPNVGGLEFLGNQKPPNFEGNYSFFRFNGGVYPTDDNQYELGGTGRRWSLLRAVTVTPGDLILSDKVTGKELYKIHEDENFIYFNDISTDRVLMKLSRNGDLFVSGRVIQGTASNPTVPAPAVQTRRPRRSAKRR